MAQIIKVYRQSVPASRFIGKKYSDTDKVDGLFSAKWGEWFQNGWFETIEKAPGFNADFFEDSDAYIGLMGCKNDEPSQYWIGMFVPEGMAVPEGFECIDFLSGTLGVCWVHGQEPDIYGEDELVMEAFRENGITPVASADGTIWFFERYGCPRFTTPDENGCVILDHCLYI